MTRFNVEVVKALRSSEVCKTQGHRTGKTVTLLAWIAFNEIHNPLVLVPSANAAFSCQSIWREMLTDFSNMPVFVWTKIGLEKASRGRTINLYVDSARYDQVDWPREIGVGIIGGSW